jgi:hypothetical protein
MRAPVVSWFLYVGSMPQSSRGCCVLNKYTQQKHPEHTHLSLAGSCMMRQRAAEQQGLLCTKPPNRYTQQKHPGCTHLS